MTDVVDAVVTLAPSLEAKQMMSQAHASGPIEPMGSGPITEEWCVDLQQRLLAASWRGPAACAQALPAAQLLRVFAEASALLKAEPTLLEIDPAALGGAPVVVVGDTHGQYHDVLRLFETAGRPGNDVIYVFNGDFVDRGAWGVETLALLLAWKAAAPRRVYLLRGNHESTYCTKYYGFQGELTAKYGPARLRGGGDAGAGAAAAPGGDGGDEDAAMADAAAAWSGAEEGEVAAAAEQTAEHDGGAGAGEGAAPDAADAVAEAGGKQQQEEQQQEEQQQQHGRPKRAAAARAAAASAAAAAAPAPKGSKAAAAAAAAADDPKLAALERAARKDLADLIKASRRLFALLPLGALIGQRTLVLHGGLFRKPPPTTAAHKGKQRRAAKAGPLQLGSLADLRAASKGGQDPNGTGASLVACDVLWSDPVLEPGLHENEARGGVGCVFGPDATAAFLAANGLSLVIRSHEGPDARLARDDLGPMDEGYTIDHDVPEGRLVTVFSAPDYPQFQAVPPGGARTRNRAAAARLTAPAWDSPEFVQWDAALPRPRACPYYDFDAATELGGSSSSDDDAGAGDEAVSSGGGGARGRRGPGGAGAAAGAAAAAAHGGGEGYGSRSSSPPHKTPHKHGEEPQQAQQAQAQEEQQQQQVQQASDEPAPGSDEPQAKRQKRRSQDGKATPTAVAAPAAAAAGASPQQPASGGSAAAAGAPQQQQQETGNVEQQPTPAPAAGGATTATPVAAAAAAAAAATPAAAEVADTTAPAGQGTEDAAPAAGAN